MRPPKRTIHTSDNKKCESPQNCVAILCSFEQLEIHMIFSVDPYHHFMPPVMRRYFPEQNEIPGERQHHKNENIETRLRNDLRKVFLLPDDNFNKYPSVKYK